MMCIRTGYCPPTAGALNIRLLLKYNWTPQNTILKGIKLDKPVERAIRITPEITPKEPYMKNNIAGKVLRILMYIALPVLAFAITVGVINYVQERRSTENSTPESSEATEISEISRSDESEINTSAAE